MGWPFLPRTGLGGLPPGFASPANGLHMTDTQRHSCGCGCRTPERRPRSPVRDHRPGGAPARAGGDRTERARGRRPSSVRIMWRRWRRRCRFSTTRTRWRTFARRTPPTHRRRDARCGGGPPAAAVTDEHRYYELVLTPPARRALSHRLPEPVAAAVIDFLNQDAAPRSAEGREASSRRVGRGVVGRNGTCRVLYRVRRGRTRGRRPQGRPPAERLPIQLNEAPPRRLLLSLLRTSPRMSTGWREPSGGRRRLVHGPLRAPPRVPSSSRTPDPGAGRLLCPEQNATRQQRQPVLECCGPHRRGAAVAVRRRRTPAQEAAWPT